MWASIIKNEIDTVRGHFTEPIAHVSAYRAKEALDRLERFSEEREKEMDELKRQIRELKYELELKGNG